MSIETEFLSMMPSTLTIAKQASKDAYGKQTFAAGTAYRCRIQADSRLVKTADGREVLSSGKAIIYGIADVDMDSRLILPDGSFAIILDYIHYNDDTGLHHTTITFGAS